MAPMVSDPRQLLVILNPARRKALYTLTSDITAYMRSQIEVPGSDSPSRRSNPSRSHGRDPPLPPRGASGSGADPNTERPVSQRITPPSAELVRVRAAALEHFDAWRKNVLSKLKEILSAPDDQTVLDERRKRLDRLAASRAETPAAGEDLLDFGPSEVSGSFTPDASCAAGAVGSSDAPRPDSVAALQQSYHPIPTRLATLSTQDRAETLCAVILLLLSTGNYSADSRTLALYLASALELPPHVLTHQETEIAKSLVETSTSETAASMTADAETEKRQQENKSKRYWKVGLASVAGAAIIGVTGGLAAPVVAGAIGGIMGGVGLGGVASFLGIFWMNGALVGTLFGAFGARMTGEMVDQYAREVEDFRFLPLKDEWGREWTKDDEKESRRLRVTIGINGWLSSKDDVTKPWRFLGNDAEVFALRYEMDRLLALGQSLEGLVGSYAWSVVKLEILKRTVLSTLWSALWPAYLLNTASYIDNPFKLARNRSDKAGQVLADALINKVQGERPVTLVGYSLGARVIYSCLKSLAERKAFGLVETVVFVGAPVPSNRSHWQIMRSVVSGKMYNVYSENDFILAFLYRATSVQLGIAGLQEVRDIEGVENLNLSEEVQGHLRYPELIGKILVRCGFVDIRGANGPIEKDPDRIDLQDADLSKDGTLIELDGGATALENTGAPPPKSNTTPTTKGEENEIAPPLPLRPGTNAPAQLRPVPIRSTTHESSSIASEPSSTAPPTYTSDPPPSYPQTSPPSQEERNPSKFMVGVDDTKYNGSGRDLAFTKPPGVDKPGPTAHDGDKTTIGGASSLSEAIPTNSTPKDKNSGCDQDHNQGNMPSTENLTDENSGDEDFTDMVSYAEPLPIED